MNGKALYEDLHTCAWLPPDAPDWEALTDSTRYLYEEMAVMIQERYLVPLQARYEPLEDQVSRWRTLAHAWYKWSQNVVTDTQAQHARYQELCHMSQQLLEKETVR